MIEGIFLKAILSPKGEQYSLTLVFILSIGWCMMKIRAILKNQSAMSEAIKTKTDEKMCLQKHSEMARSMADLKAGSKSIIEKIDGLVNVLLQKKGG